MVGVLGFDCWGVMLGFWGKGVQLIGLWVCRAGLRVFFGVWAVCIKIEE